MPKSKIEWTNFSINPVKGLCPVDCKDNQGKSYCYARRMYKRFHWDETIRFEPGKAMEELLQTKAGDKIFWGSTMELFGAWVKPEWREWIYDCVNLFNNRTHIFLTKRPENLPKGFPRNCRVGVTIAHSDGFLSSIKYLYDIEATVKFISFEPLLWWSGYVFPKTLAETLRNYGISQVIIGAQTPYNVKTAPSIEWVKEISIATKEAGLALFEKNNLQPLLKRKLIQELPE